MGVLARIMTELVAQALNTEVVIIDATYLKIHRTVSSLAVQTYGPPRLQAIIL